MIETRPTSTFIPRLLVAHGVLTPGSGLQKAGSASRRKHPAHMLKTAPFGRDRQSDRRILILLHTAHSTKPAPDELIRVSDTVEQIWRMTGITPRTHLQLTDFVGAVPADAAERWTAEMMPGLARLPAQYLVSALLPTEVAATGNTKANEIERDEWG